MSASAWWQTSEPCPSPATTRSSTSTGSQDRWPRPGSGTGRCRGWGGLRKPARDSINTGWRNVSFRGYADYMQTRSFEEAIEELIALTGEHVTVIMCAEAVFWRCHRRLVADALLVRGIDVQHIMGASTLIPAEMTSFASVRGTRVTYPSTPL